MISKFTRILASPPKILPQSLSNTRFLHHKIIKSSSSKIPSTSPQSFNRQSCRCSVRVHYSRAKLGPVTTVDRCFASSSSDDKSGGRQQFLPPLMAGPSQLAWRPPIFTAVWMAFQIASIRNKLDPEFSIEQFIKGARQALITVSDRLATADTASMGDLIEASALAEITSNLSKYTPVQRSALRVSPTDAMVCFPQKIRVLTSHRTSEKELIEKGLTKPMTRTVQILTVFHVWKGVTEEELKKKNFKDMYFNQKFHECYMICNYRFVRKFENGRSTQWMIDFLTHLTLDPSETSAATASPIKDSEAKQRRNKRRNDNKKKKSK